MVYNIVNRRNAGAGSCPSKCFIPFFETEPRGPDTLDEIHALNPNPWAGVPLAQMICPASVTAAIAALLLSDILNEDIFKKRIQYSQVLLITVHYIKLHQITF
jgi:hypothetical protein